MKYYIIPQNKIVEFTPLMEQSFGHSNISIRMNLAETFGLMQFTDELAPEGYQAYTVEEIKFELESDEWIEDYTYQKGKVLRIYDMSSEFKLPVDSIANVAHKVNTEYDEFTGLKIKSEYINENGEKVADKIFTIYDENGKKGTKVTIKFYDRNDEIDESETVETLDFYSDLQIKQHKKKCVIRVFERLLWDFDVEIDQLEYLIDNADEATKAAMLPVIGVPDIPTLEGLPDMLRSLFDDLLKNLLVTEVDIMYKTGDPTDLYNAMSTIDYPFLDQQALTSEQEVKLTYRQIMLNKFNPQNFEFYA
jgi:hypothetical protein